MITKLILAAALFAVVAHSAPRPQTPQPPFPYQAEEVTYVSAPGVALSATLTIPAGKGPFPAVLLIAGSGPIDRDETYLDHKPFAVLADYLSRHGIATLRADKRGRGKSGGDYHAATTYDFADDARAGLAYLRARPEIDLRHIGLIGHSEGGMISPLVAAKDNSVGFIVAYGGPSLRIEAILPIQKRLDMLGHGVPANEVEKSLAVDAKVFALSKGPGTEDEVRAKIKALLVAEDPKMPSAEVEGTVKAFASPWMRVALPFDPAAWLRQVRCPIAMFYGEKDVQVPPADNVPVAKAALAGNPDASIVVLPGLNHIGQTAGTGLGDEYGKIEETMSPVVLAAITDWIRLHTAR